VKNSGNQHIEQTEKRHAAVDAHLGQFRGLGHRHAPGHDPHDGLAHLRLRTFLGCVVALVLSQVHVGHRMIDPRVTRLCCANTHPPPDPA
jgi:hypothetical protein